jgi:hypothetical protein
MEKSQFGTVRPKVREQHVCVCLSLFSSSQPEKALCPGGINHISKKEISLFCSIRSLASQEQVYQVCATML